MDRERLALRPLLDVARDDLPDRLLVRAHARAVERRQHQPPPRQMVTPLEQQQRPRPEDRQQRERPPGRQAVLGLAVQRPDRVGIREHHQRRLEPQEPHAEVVPEPPPAGLQERDRPQQPARRLNERRLARAVEKECGHRCDRRYTAVTRRGRGGAGARANRRGAGCVRSHSSRAGSRPAWRSAMAQAVWAWRRRRASPSGITSTCSLSAGSSSPQNGQR